VISVKFIEEIKSEYAKVTWPNKDEVKNATIIVAAMSVAMSLYLGLFDLIASRLMDLLVSVFGG
jgi:preprotein translocase subunit SecE